jgi:hypothetical protein
VINNNSKIKFLIYLIYTPFYAITVTCPGNVIEMLPPHIHINFELLLMHGIFLTMTVGFPGVHGAGVLGIQGIGVNTPNAAAVADATVGLANEVHIPKGGILTMGLLSMIFAIGLLEAKTILSGRILSVLGANPNGHIIIPPVVFTIPIIYLL